MTGCVVRVEEGWRGEGEGLYMSPSRLRCEASAQLLSFHGSATLRLFRLRVWGFRENARRDMSLVTKRF